MVKRPTRTVNLSVRISLVGAHDAPEKLERHLVSEGTTSTDRKSLVCITFGANEMVTGFPH